MKHSSRHILFGILATFLPLLLLTSCSTKKNTGATRFWQSFNTRFNVYFNGSEAYKAGLEEKNADYQAQITELQSKIDDENKRSDELSEYEKYVKTKKFVEEIAKNKFGLIYPDELVFKPNNK